jgi:hypothetical protein
MGNTLALCPQTGCAGFRFGGCVIGAPAAHSASGLRQSKAM